jgi:hypothetical protein
MHAIVDNVDIWGFILILEIGGLTVDPNLGSSISTVLGFFYLLISECCLNLFTVHCRFITKDVS